MNARVSKEEIALHLPQTMSHYFRDEDVIAQAAKPERRSFAELCASMVRWIAEIPRRRAVLDELSMLSDHELSDIGLTRGDLSRVFEPGFAAARADADRGRAMAGHSAHA